jgi:hypothetical protein
MITFRAPQATLSFVAPGFQLPHSRWSDSPSARSRVNHPGLQPDIRATWPLKQSHRSIGKPLQPESEILTAQAGEHAIFERKSSPLATRSGQQVVRPPSSGARNLLQLSFKSLDI